MSFNTMRCFCFAVTCAYFVTLQKNIMMGITTTIFLAIALAMDCFAISITIGIKEKTYRLSTVSRTSIAFGLFQAVMPLIGWYATLFVRESLIAYGHWIAFGLLMFIGLKMLVEAIRGNDEESGNFDVRNMSVLIWLAIATSIDALAVGVSYGALGVEICVPAIVIGIFSSLFAVIGTAIGVMLGNVFGNKAEIIGGIVLCVLGIKILLENLL